MKTKQIMLKAYDPVPFRPEILYGYYVLKHQLKTKSIIYNTIFSKFSLQTLQSLNFYHLFNRKLTKSEVTTLAQGFLIILALGHIIALGIQIFLSIQATTHVYAHPLQSYVSQREFLFWSSAFLLLTRFVEVIGLIMRQTWGWFLTQFTYISALPLLLFSSLVVPDPQLIGDTLVYLGIVVVMYHPAVWRIYFPKIRSSFLFFLFAMIANSVFLLMIETVKTMV